MKKVTDLKNGIIEIHGYEVNAKTTPEDVVNNLNGTYINHSKSSSGKSESFTFDNILIADCKFSIDVCFYLEKLDSIKLEAYHEYDGESTWKKDHELNDQWLEENLGPMQTFPDYSQGYKSDVCFINSFYMSDSRCGEEAYITIRYNEE